MPKFKSEKIVVKGQDNEVALSFYIDINVDAEGFFTTTLPADVADILKESGISLKTNGRRNARAGFFAYPTLKELVDAVKAQCNEYVSCQLIEEKVIIQYAIMTTAAYLIDSKNEIVPNGNWLNGLYGTEPKYNWRNGTESQSQQRRHPFSISIMARPIIKRSYRYKSGKDFIKHEKIPSHIKPGENIIPFVVMGENLYWLNGIPCSKFPDTEIVEIDYTEKVAYFFVNFIKTICKLNESLVHLTDPENVKLISEQKFNLLEFKK